MSKRCMARVLPGARCPYDKSCGEFCRLHSKVSKRKTKRTAVPHLESPFAWQHHGRWDEPPPPHFDPSKWDSSLFRARLLILLPPEEYAYVDEHLEHNKGKERELLEKIQSLNRLDCLP